VKTALPNSIGILTCGFPVPTVQGDGNCHVPEEGDGTGRGGNEMIVPVEERSYRQLQGRIHAPDRRPLGDALAEIFGRPEYPPSSGALSSNPPEQQRLVVCPTTADGKFCSCSLWSGIYELHSSVSTGWNVTKIHIVVDKHAGQNKTIVVTRHLGT
jgi:hypothetical protein